MKRELKVANLPLSDSLIRLIARRIPMKRELKDDIYADVPSIWVEDIARRIPMKRELKVRAI